MIFRRLFSKYPPEPRALYESFMAQSRQPVFYQDYKVADTLDGRFDMLVLHACLLFRRLAREGDDARQLSQDTFDVMFKEMDRALREMGVSDIVVPKKIKPMISAFYGRADAYGTALDAADAEGLEAALARNLSRTEDDRPALQALARYVVASEAHLARASLADLEKGRFRWLSPEPETSEGGDT